MISIESVNADRHLESDIASLNFDLEDAQRGRRDAEKRSVCISCLAYSNMPHLFLPNRNDEVCCHYRSIRVHVRADVIFTRQTEDGNIMHVPAYFSTSPQDVDGGHDVHLGAITSDISAQVQNWNSRGSNFMMDRIIRFVLCITKFRLLHGLRFWRHPNVCEANAAL